MGKVRIDTGRGCRCAGSCDKCKAALIEAEKEVYKELRKKFQPEQELLEKQRQRYFWVLIFIAFIQIINLFNW